MNVDRRASLAEALRRYAAEGIVSDRKQANRVHWWIDANMDLLTEIADKIDSQRYAACPACGAVGSWDAERPKRAVCAYCGDEQPPT